MRARGPGCGCLGCGGGSLLVLVVLGALAWFMVIRPAQDFLSSWRAPQTQSGQAPSQGGNSSNSGVVIPPLGGGQGNTNTAGGAASADAPLTRTDVQKFVRVRRDVRQALGDSFTGLQQVWTDIQNGQNPNLFQAVGVLRSAGGSIAAARSAQASALQREKLSPERYAAIRAGVNRALGLPNVDFARAAEALQRGQLPDLNSTVVAATTQEKAMVEPFRRELMTTSAAGLLGL
ncbi:hypothetical protein [Deinococcus hohokamensis]|uniref:Uncharacterized protein n=1 Tax=Deinococcus hohokamensis TaxID=309883 RepID=A0ABV9I7S0_9DEIO